MVGIFTRHNRSSPRPARVDHASPPNDASGQHSAAFPPDVHGTTTPAVTLTAPSGSHFFSLPLWRKRGSPTHTPTVDLHPTAGRASADELGLLRKQSQSTVSLRNKELPPTPSSPSDPRLGAPAVMVTERVQLGTKPVDVRSTSMDEGILPPSFIRRGSPSPGESSSAVLARAALGLGLPHVMPNSVSATSSSTEVNTIAFMTTESPLSGPSGSSTPVSTIRRAKSYQTVGQPAADEQMRERRRSRGMSAGPYQMLALEKGKEKQLEPVEDGGAQATQVQKPLLRKSSFWSRRRQETQVPPPTVAPPPPEQSLKPSLPSVQPVSPFHVDTSIPGSGQDAGPSSAALRRRHSERSRTTSKPDADQTPPLPTGTPTVSRFRRPKRPQTADSAANLLQSNSLSSDTSHVLLPSPPVAAQMARIQESAQSPAPSAAPSRPTTAGATARPRSSTNPPLLHRLSMNLFGSSTPSPSPSAPTLTPNMFGDLSASPSSSPGSSRKSISRPSIEIPKPRIDEETPEAYLHRLMDVVPKADIGGVLATNGDPFYAQALQLHIGQFDFTGDPLDVALRKLLMHVGLPRETQQIDRVIEAFAARYRHCNPDLFKCDDHPYVLAFSLIMLHTDAFNKSNKRKMTKPDYVKNTRLDGVASEVLDCFYDNIVFAPFIFIEDPGDLHGQRGLIPEVAGMRRMSTFGMPTTSGSQTPPGSGLLGGRAKIDPYYLIAQGLLDDLRVNIETLVPGEDPYVYQGTEGPWDEEELHRAFAQATALEVNVERYTNPTWLTMSSGAGTGPVFQMPPLPALVGQGEVWTLKVTKLGVLLRKEDVAEGGRRAINRKWREWTVLLTSSQLLFFRDPSFAPTLRAQMQAAGRQQVALPQPDEYVTVRDTVAVFDKSYTKHRNTFRLVLADGRHYLFQTPEEKDMNDWISRINYASAFRSSGVRMRTMGMSSQDIALTGMAAAVSHMRDLEQRVHPPPSPRVRTWYGNPDENSIASDLSSPEPTLSTSPSSMNSNGASVMSPMDNSRLFKATFDQVKNDLAANRWRSLDETGPPPVRPRALSLESTLNSPPLSPVSLPVDTVQGSSRPRLIGTKLKDLEAKIASSQTRLDDDMRFVRNLAVLTPFQRTTRDRMQAAVQVAAKRIMQVRLDLARLTCYRDVLADDLRADERNWQWTRKVALRAATEKLDSERPPEVPRMTISMYIPDQEISALSSPLSIPSTSSTSRSSISGHESLEESFQESFHSALDDSGLSSSDWFDDVSRSLEKVEVSPPPTRTFFESPPVNTKHGEVAYPFPRTAERPQGSAFAQEVSSGSTATAASETETATHQKFYTAPEMSEEQAEDWNKTRAAKRVSLVKLPTDLRISVLFGRHEGLSESPETTPSSLRASATPYARTEALADTVAMLDL